MEDEKVTEELIENWIIDELVDTREMDLSEARSDRTQNIVKMIEAYKDLQESKAKTLDLEEKRRIEEMKTVQTLEVERAKLKTNWPELLLKGLGTLLMFCATSMVDIGIQERNLKFEETGHFTSTTVRNYRPYVHDWKFRPKRR